MAAALALMTLTPSLAHAQTFTQTTPGEAAPLGPGGNEQDPLNDQRAGERSPTGRLARRQRQPRAPQPPSAEEIQAAAQGVLTATNTNCQITESRPAGPVREQGVAV
ncbi:hypothetical protein [Brevundimonas diminuta]|uniref:hypothetical protein n=1 Tax=Brevundimonas diminuta TaxID=293 RepID=UPI003D9A6EB0